MATWEEYLQPSSFDGVSFPVSSRTVGGGRAWVGRRYPNRAGQGGEDLGREPLTFELEVPLFHGVDPDHYPATYEALRGAFDHPTTQGEAEYVDQEYGPLNAKVTKWQWIQSADKRDGGILRISIEEVSHDDIVFRTDARDAQRDAETHATDLDDFGLAEADLEYDFAAAGVPLSVDEQDYVSGELWSTQVTRFVEGLDDGIASAADVASRVDNLRTRLDIAANLPALQGPSGVYTLHSIARLAASLTALGEAAVIKTPPLVAHTLATSQSVYEISSSLYGTPDRADEILQRNPSATPLFIPAGTALVVLAA
jgi:prophage DNA circulation protein